MVNAIILVPLDGSETSEGVLPYATALAGATGSRIKLMIVWENVEETLAAGQADLAAQIAVSGQEACRRYVEEQAAKVSAAGLTVDTQVAQGKPAEEVLRIAGESEAGFIALASHGRSGISRWWAGSVATRVIRQASVPVLVAGPEALGRTESASFKRILVPLDGSELAEGALTVAAELASQGGGEIALVQVLRWSTQAFMFGVPDVDAARMDEELTEASEAYLARMQGTLSVPARTRVLHGVPAEELLNLIDSEPFDLVVMGTHGRGAIMRVALGSVAERMVHGKTPVLLVREGATSSAG